MDPSFVSWNMELGLNQKNDGIMVTSPSRLDLVTPLTLNAICTAKLLRSGSLVKTTPRPMAIPKPYQFRRTKLDTTVLSLINQKRLAGGKVRRGAQEPHSKKGRLIELLFVLCALGIRHSGMDVTGLREQIIKRKRAVSVPYCDRGQICSTSVELL